MAKIKKSANMGKLLFLGALTLLLAPCHAGCAASQPPASPPMADRFTQMDVNGDGKVVIEEFRAAFPSMGEQAFAIIDKNGDQGIDQTEWGEFMTNHAKSTAPRREGAPMNNIPGDPLIPPPDSSDLPLVRPPAGMGG